ncbi:Na+/H+ antiporter NhaC family protein [Natronobacterium gregoryi]|uniref:Na+/H+ antiporter n=2 Tax=Natronobacterium gregoryi TaxID=44930 RepID=L0ADR4_NATGS|nr:Na+/H+ antiporter NhaC family protein [Natronobacterium gregoryi]AFZ71277.1 Na+/H+ antiporter [Natronobacterium gregoryi SP2]ELY67366.1 Na+/H+ antiporter NhaC-like protein [Natronobacterium gregoryi SP2]PLK19860.1 sodium:proton antiporter [Natronobacterium gregoryi SP2]SFJ39353.1 transporter, NhaC family [Natronobacterium gregoryi]
MGTNDTDPTDEFSVESGDDSGSLDLEFYGGRGMSAFPLAFFIIWAILQTALWRIADTAGLTIGMLIGLIVGMFFVKGSWTGYANTIFEGMSQPVAVTAVVAWMWAGMFAETMQAGGFVDGLVWLADLAGVGSTMFPAISFVLAALLATGIGTGYGTVIAFVVLFFPAGVLLGANPVLLFAAILSGAIFGDNLAPVSDTTIVSAVTQDSDIGGVVATRFKYAIIAALIAFPAYIVASSTMPGLGIEGDAREIFLEAADPAGLIHLLSMGIVIGAAVKGRHIVEAISWGIVAAVAFNLVFGLAAIRDIVVFRAPADGPLVEALGFLPFLEVLEPGADTVGVGGSLIEGITGFFELAILILFIIAGAQIMIRGGAFEALLTFTFERLATNVRNAELTMVGSSAFINAIITINTAAEIAIGPYISKLGEQFNINGYRRANILDANTAALGYIFPWSGGVLVGFEAMQGLPDEYDWFETGMIVNPIEVVPYVFQGWLLVAVFVVAAITGFGREYVIDRESDEVARI